MIVLDYAGDEEAMVYAQLGQHPLARATEAHRTPDAHRAPAGRGRKLHSPHSTHVKTALERAVQLVSPHARQRRGQQLL